MISSATEMFQAGADLLRLASLAMATDHFWKVGMSLLDAGMNLIQAAKTGTCPCDWAEPKECQDCGGEEACLGGSHVIV
jgi:hypothetical protein